jgi:glycosyltransferase involved in cell wall biosynthesis
MPARTISVVVPVYNEAENIAPCLRGLARVLDGSPHEILVCYDFDEDTTLAAVAAMPDRPASVRLVKNELGPGAANALRAGFEAAAGDVVITTMADLSDPPDTIPAMAALVRDGAAVVSGSRYMPGGSMQGGPFLKRNLSRWACLTLRWFAGLGTHDATNNFRAYEPGFLRRAGVESNHAFDIALELTVKAHLAGERVDQVPSSWTDRSAGDSRFQVWAWMPMYLRWWWRAMMRPVLTSAVLTVALVGALRMLVPTTPWAAALAVAATAATAIALVVARRRYSSSPS